VFTQQFSLFWDGAVSDCCVLFALSHDLAFCWKAPSPVRSCGAATQWTAQSGGNGHWYASVIFKAAVNWNTASAHAGSLGGYLATVTSQAELEIIRTAALAQDSTAQCTGHLGPYLGGYQDMSAPDYSEPSSGWRWVTGEAWTWGADFLSNSGPYASENSLHLLCPDYNMNDVSDLETIVAAIIEWDAIEDCNANQIVDTCETALGGTTVVCVSYQPFVC
jgi:hypothetical protein